MLDNLSDRVAALSPERRAMLLAQLRQKRGAGAGEDGRPFPLSRSQWVMWFLHQIEPASPAYNVAFALAIHSEVDVDALRRAFERLVGRHAALRAVYAIHEGKPVQQVRPEAGLHFEEVDGSALSPSELELRLREAHQRPFDLESGPVLRVCLFRRARAESVLLLSAHHVALDLWSIAVLMDELGVVYAAERAGRPHPLPPVDRQFRDFVEWQASMLGGPAGERLWEYWQAKLAGELPVLDLPTDRPRPPMPRLRGATRTFELSPELTRRLKALAGTERTTLYSTLLAAFQTLLHRYSGQEDILVGSPMAARTRADFARVVGCVTNFVVLRSRPAPGISFRAFLGRVSQTVREALEHQDYPFSRLVERLQLTQDPSRRPLTDIGFCLERGFLAPGDAATRAEIGGLSLEALPFLAQQEGQFDLYLEMVEVEGALRGGLRYSPDLFEASTIERMVANFERLLEGIVADPEQSLGELPVLSEAELLQLAAWNATTADFPTSRCFPELFEEQVARTPGSTAVVCGQQRLSYAELNRRAHRLARRLVAAGVEPGRVVAVLAERGCDWLVGLLAVFKAGGVYLPLDPRYPGARLANVLGQSRAGAVLVQEAHRERLADALRDRPSEGASVLPLELDAGADAADEADELPTRSRPEDLAYVIFTSGSTGTPKGAMVEHRGMLNHLYLKVADLKLDAGDRVAQTASQCFDISVWQALAALLVGGEVHVLVDDVAHHPARLLAEVERERITILETVPSLLRVMLEAATEAKGSARPSLAALRWLIPTGEALPPELCRQWFRAYPDIPLMNAYGPTECSDDVTHAPILGPPDEEVVRMPIGRPVANMRLYVLDAGRQPVPIGAIGELYVGGVGVGRGYLHDCARTDEAFLRDPFDAAPGARLYRTGDLGRWRADGWLEYVGRIDHQVKLRGFRIELGEIETALRQHPGVADVAVLAREDVPGQQQLVTYVVAAAGAPAPTSRALRDFVAARLPAYMVPAVVVALPTMPLTANGKVDRRALPAPQRGAVAGHAAVGREPFVAPGTATERALAGVWAAVLELDRLGIHDNFFELGGNSILGMQVIARAAEVGLALTTRDLYQHPTIAALAAVAGTSEVGRAAGGADDAGPSLTAAQEQFADRYAALGAQDVYPLSPMQAGILFHSLLAPDSGAYFLQFRCRLTGELHPARLRQAGQAAVARHPVLRTSFHWEGLDAPVQVVHGAAELPFAEHDWRELPGHDQERQLEQYLEADRRRGFALDRAPLIRMAILRVADDAAWLVLSFHHLVLDGWSLALVLGELLGGEAPREPARPFRDYIAWLQRQDLARAEAFWRDELRGLAGPTPLGGDDGPPARRHSEQAIRLSEAATLALESFARRHRLTLNTVVRGVWALLLSQHSGLSDVMFGATVAGRAPTLRGSDAMVGLFINTLPVRVQVRPEMPLLSWLQRLQDQEVALREYDYSSLVQVQGWSGLARGEGLFESNFVFENYPLDDDLRGGKAGRRVDDARVFEQGTVPLTVMAMPGAELTVAMSYDGERFAAATIAGLLERFQQTLDEIVADPARPLGALQRAEPGPAPAERRRPAAESGSEQVAPRTDVEAVVAAVWSELLQAERIGVHDSFFELGGHSLMVMQVISRLNGLFKTDLPMRAIFEAPTVAGMAELLVRHEAAPGRTDSIARLRRRVEAMSPDQIRAALQSRRIAI